MRSTINAPQAEAQSPASPAQTAVTKTQPTYTPPEHDVMALVNGQDINRQQLAMACVERYGEDVLESLVNKQLIEHHCRKRGITISSTDIEAEVDRIARRFKLDRGQWLGLLEKERGIKPEEYKRDILWPTIALRRLAGSQIAVTEDEFRKAYESQFGPMVRVRLIVLADAARATQLQRELAAQPDDFARVAMQESKDVNSASIGGLIQPIRLHTGDPIIEQAAFALKPGEVSSVLQVGEQQVLVKCEGHIPPRNQPIESVRGTLEEQIKEEKLRKVAGGFFEKLQNAATVKNIYNDPQLRQAMPGVVATVNGEQITMKQLGAECLARHGEPVLEGEISRTLLQQELKRTGAAVTQGELEAEMAHAAVLAGVTDTAGNADLKRWIELSTTEQDVSYEIYLRDSVWPSAALKTLTGDKVQVTDEDLKKGFEANYGPRVRCRAIVLASMRRAQEVWAKARENTSLEYFGDLAVEYSIEPTSKTLRGEVPPIRQHGGQPQLEQAAFGLQAGEMSGVVQVGDKFVILRCEGRTEPEIADMNVVREILNQDIFEKKLRIAMAETFDRLKANARIDNYLAGTSQAPPARQAGGPKQDTAVRPTAATR
ncbi:MAG: peptidyl-prolyl cis-trans isomerase [Planctomycetota bacterium]